ncbi:MAG: hypothetical protein K2J84_09125 [Bacteroidaceae bacterium]|nr:hypothetical protein [Bacteroidaceae bacterium]
MKKSNKILLLASFLLAWGMSAGAQERTVELVKDGQVVFSMPASEIEYMTVVNRLPVPKNVRGAVDGGKVTVTWDAVNGATSYKVFRSSDGNSFSQVGTSPSNSFTDNSPLSGSNYYRVQAFGADDTQGGMSAATLPVTGGVQEESGIYLGLIGFNQNLQHYPINLLTEESKQGYYDFIDAFSSDNNGTALYYAVDQAISTLQSKPYPADLNKAYIVTFTDGFDNYSRQKYEFGKYPTAAACGDDVKLRLVNDKVSGIGIMGYAVGLEIDEVSDAEFEASLDRIASSSSTRYVNGQMSAVEAKFKDIARNITEVNKTQSITVSIAPGADEKGRIRFTFDLPKECPINAVSTSNLYIEGTFQSLSEISFKLTNITAKGLTLEGTEVDGTMNAEGLVDFTFKEVATNNKKLIDATKALEWTGASDWKKDKEFNKEGDDAKTEVIYHSAAIILVLDCTTSLGEENFKAMQTSAKSFIATLLDQTYSEDPGDDPGNDPSEDSNYNGHAYVDLGLPSGIKWATCNVGASSPSDYGNYYAWGETTTKDTYTEENNKTWEKELGEISGNPEYDVARANWGGSWRLPSEAELEELLNKCTWTWMSQGGHNGYKVTGPNGNSIFLPAAGFRYGSSLSYAESYGFYWSSTPYESNTRDASALYFNSSNPNVGWYGRDDGQAVRPVSE